MSQREERWRASSPACVSSLHGRAVLRRAAGDDGVGAMYVVNRNRGAMAFDPCDESRAASLTPPRRDLARGLRVDGARCYVLAR